MLVTGGCSGASCAEVANTAELWLPGGSVAVAPMAERRVSHLAVALPGGPGRALAFSTATVLAGGEVWLAGGYGEQINATAQAWRIRRASTGANSPSGRS